MNNLLRNKFMLIACCGLAVVACNSSDGVSAKKQLANLGDKALEACLESAKSEACEDATEKLSDIVYKQLSQNSDIDEEDVEDSVKDAMDFAVQMGKDFSGISILKSKPDDEVGKSVVLGTSVATTLSQLSSEQPVPLVLSNSTIPADSVAPVKDPKGENGWYYKSTGVGATSEKKINWYFLTDYSGDDSFTVGDVDRVDFFLRLDSIDSEFIVGMYTNIEEDGDDAASWYRSRVNRTPNTSHMAAQNPGDTVVLSTEADSGDVDLEISVGSTVYSDGNSSLEDIADESVRMLSLGTNSASSEGENEFLLKKVSVKMGSKSYDLIPVAYGEVAANNFQAIAIAQLAETLYYQVKSGTDTFNNFSFKVTVVVNDAITISAIDGGQLTLAQKTLVEKLNRGESYDALLPEAVYNPESGKLEYDLGTALSLADIEDISVTAYSNKNLKAENKLEGSITIDKEGDKVEVDSLNVVIP